MFEISVNASLRCFYLPFCALVQVVEFRFWFEPICELKEVFWTSHQMRRSNGHNSFLLFLHHTAKSGIVISVHFILCVRDVQGTHATSSENLSIGGINVFVSIFNFLCSVAHIHICCSDPCRLVKSLYHIANICKAMRMGNWRRPTLISCLLLLHLW